jgi:hypothetical protein
MKVKTFMLTPERRGRTAAALSEEEETKDDEDRKESERRGEKGRKEGSKRTIHRVDLKDVEGWKG